MSTSNVSADSLRTLHRLHRQVADLHGRLDRGPKKIRNAALYVAHQEHEVEQAREELKKLRMAADAKQVQQKSGEAKIADLGRKLNEAKSNAEYQALQHQIKGVRMTNSVLDDEILETWERIDQQKQKVAEAEAGLDQAHQKAREVHEQVEAKLPGIRADLERCEAELKEVEAGLPGEMRDLYRRVVRHRGEDALAEIDNQCCSGCYTQIPLNVISGVMLGQPTFCKTCGRLLYFPEDAAKA
jgi:uncharacterized protein